MHSKIWFKNRIGKRIYREPTKCKCKDCDDVVKNGIVIIDENHAEYLYEIHNDLRFEYYYKPIKK